jgi:hypothetical protein
MNKILISFGTEDVRLRDLATDKKMSDKQLAEILDLLESLDKYVQALAGTAATSAITSSAATRRRTNCRATWSRSATATTKRSITFTPRRNWASSARTIPI